MRILLLCRSLDVGGSERQLVNLALGLHAQGHPVAVAVFYGKGALESELHAAGVPVLDLRKSGRWDALAFFWRMKRAVAGYRPQVLYGFLSMPNVMAVVLKPFFPGLAVAWGVRSSYMALERYGWLLRLSFKLECLLARFADLIICNSRAGLEYAAAQGFPRKRMVTIPNGFDVERFRPDAVGRERVRAEWGVGSDVVLVGIVGRLDPMKDHVTFLRAAQLLVNAGAGARFVCVGEGPEGYREQLRREATALGIDAHLTWAGERHDMPAVFSALDIAVSSSIGEGFPNTVAEAMACGVPCVVTDVGDSAMIVGELGEVVPKSNPQALSQGLRRMMARLCAPLRAEVRASIVNRFTNDVLISDTALALQRLAR